jgi:hypothetical protein
VQIIRGVTFVSAVATVVLALFAGDYRTALAFTCLTITHSKRRGDNDGPGSDDRCRIFYLLGGSGGGRRSPSR